MNILSVGEIASKIIDSVGNTGDKLFTSDEERLTIQAKIEQIILEFAGKEIEQITERHKADMASDSKLAKNIRPSILIVTATLLVIVTIGSMFGIYIPDKLFDLMYMVNGLTFGFYYGSRGFEKIAGMFAGVKK